MLKRFYSVSSPIQWRTQTDDWLPIHVHCLALDESKTAQAVSADPLRASECQQDELSWRVQYRMRMQYIPGNHIIQFPF